ncbi:hypothetical protein DY000_02022810 [Brassica cretica]|uniref:Reverse transcriptase zinc-binding domain-containing protein n=1 Tax=Brassica cretica TaxID=69181 RepID=A0ABQ7EGG7_BRACR|nr:hypothetical protein DY000_02022810 [Brassica cretica]
MISTNCRRRNKKLPDNKLRHEVTQWLQIKPGDGSSIRFWYFPWSPFGPLIKFVGANGPRLSGIPLSATLASIWTGSSWTIAPAHSVALEQIQIHMSTITLTDFTDLPTWNTKGIGNNNNNEFVISQNYDSLRESRPKVRWNKAVWCSKGIPKHKTLSWLFVLNRCPTRDHLLSWGLHTDASCLLCNNFSIPSSFLLR